MVWRELVLSERVLAWRPWKGSTGVCLLLFIYLFIDHTSWSPEAMAGIVRKESINESSKTDIRRKRVNQTKEISHRAAACHSIRALYQSSWSWPFAWVLPWSSTVHPPSVPLCQICFPPHPRPPRSPPLRHPRSRRCRSRCGVHPRFNRVCPIRYTLFCLLACCRYVPTVLSLSWLSSNL